MTAVPEALGVNVAEQVAVTPVPDRVHGEPAKVPGAPVLVKATVPVGVLVVPTSVSVTVAVHVDACPMLTLEGVHTIPVDVARLLTVTLVLPLLVA